MTTRKKKVEAAPAFQMNPALVKVGIRLRPYRQEIIGGILLLLTTITLLSLLALTQGSLSDLWAAFFTQLFGWAAIPAVLLLGLLGAALTFGRLKDEAYTLPLDIVVGLELLVVVGLSGLHLLAAPDSEQAVRLAQDGGGGGFVGWGLSSFFVELLGLPLTGLLLFLLGATGIALTFRLGMGDVTYWADRFNEWAKHRSEDEPPFDDEILAPEQITEIPAPPPKAPAPRQKGAKQPTPALPAKSATPTNPATVMPRARYPLPALDLLALPTKNPTHNANTRYQAQIIEETLYGFGVPTEVVEINRGPTITQFGLKLGTIERKLPDGNVVQRRIRVNKIVSLSNDLALALAAAPIRIEAPVPGRPLVGIEVPNTEKAMVSLREGLEDAVFKKTKGALRVVMGRGVAGQTSIASLASMPHLLIAGATGSGKSVCINSLITTLLFTHAPEQLRFLMVDPKMVELTSFNGIPHLIAPVVTDFEQVVGALAWATREMERRYKLFAGASVRSIGGYNRKVGAKGERLPYLVIVIDELADLMMMAPDEVERHICRIAQMARATGIHLVIATQRPSVNVVTGLIKANFPARIAFAVTSQIDSRVILDTPGAERLLGQGDMLYMAPDAPKLARLQGCFVSDAEINNVVQYWQTVNASHTPPENNSPDPASSDPPWAKMMAEAGKDAMLEEAVKLVVEAERASTSLLQRRLGIGYPRASRLMDQLEDEGIIGPADGSKPREVFWKQEPDTAEEDDLPVLDG